MKKIMITNKDITELFNIDGSFIYEDKIVSYEMAEQGETFMECYIQVFDTITKTKEKILFRECAKKTTDIFKKKFIETITEKLNKILEK